MTNWIPGQARNDEVVSSIAAISSLRRAWVSPGGFRRADEGPPVLLSGANAPHSVFSRIPPGVDKTDARRKPQHFVIPDLIRNPETFSPARSAANRLPCGDAASKNLIDELDSGSSPE
jgi:hypothetical protein